MFPSVQTVTYSLLGGVLPALLWLIFWLREDKKRPEPRGFILRTFILGMIAVPLVIPFEKATLVYLSGTGAVILVWAFIEEIFKFAAAYFGGLRSRAMDEPIDALIYLITAALGFTALENTLFLLTPIGDGNFLLGFLTGNVRFIGATLLHTIASGAIGLSIAFSYYKNGFLRGIYVFFGIILATVLHTLFNSFILNDSGDGNLFAVFAGVWLGIVALLLLFEKVKKIRKKKRLM